MQGLIDLVKCILWSLFVCLLGAMVWNALVFCTPLRIWYKAEWPTGVKGLLQGFGFMACIIFPIGMIFANYGDNYGWNIMGVVLLVILTPVFLSVFAIRRGDWRSVAVVPSYTREEAKALLNSMSPYERAELEKMARKMGYIT